MTNYPKLLLPFLTLFVLSACNAVPDTDNEGDEAVHQYTLDTTKGTATDAQAHLIWQNASIDHGTREEAIAHCQALDFAGITDWKLPTSAQSRVFHAGMNAQGNTPKQAFDRCTAEVTSDGYVRTKKGAEQYGGKPGDSINFTGGANIRCVSEQ